MEISLDEDEVEVLRRRIENQKNRILQLERVLTRLLDAAKSYRSDILKLSRPVTDSGNWKLYGHLYHAPKWPGRDKSIAWAEWALGNASAFEGKHFEED